MSKINAYVTCVNLIAGICFEGAVFQYRPGSEESDDEEDDEKE